jgi:hypothetical protein
MQAYGSQQMIRMMRVLEQKKMNRKQQNNNAIANVLRQRKESTSPASADTTASLHYSCHAVLFRSWQKAHHQVTLRADNLSCICLRISGSGSGSTLRGLARGESSLLAVVHDLHSVPWAAFVGYSVLHLTHS